MNNAPTPGVSADNTNTSYSLSLSLFLPLPLSPPPLFLSSFSLDFYLFLKEFEAKNRKNVQISEVDAQPKEEEHAVTMNEWGIEILETSQPEQTPSSSLPHGFQRMWTEQTNGKSLSPLSLSFSHLLVLFTLPSLLSLSLSHSCYSQRWMRRTK